MMVILQQEIAKDDVAKQKTAIHPKDPNLLVAADLNHCHPLHLLNHCHLLHQ